MTVTEVSIGMIPNSSVTIGSQEPATGTIVHVIVVYYKITMLPHSTCENSIFLMFVLKLVPVIVSVLPLRTTFVMREAG